jgi:hypothetical protein
MTENAIQDAVQEAELPKTRIPDTKPYVRFQPGFGWAFVLSFLILALKNDLADVFYPLLYNEDGRNIFGLFYNDHSIKNIFTRYSSYFQVLPRLTAYLIHFLPVTWIPSLYSLFALSFSALAYSLFFPLLNRLFRSPWFALYSVLILTALPLASHKLVGALMYQVWNGVIILGVVAFLSIPKKTLGKVLYLCAVNILIWSHPYCILVLPVYLFKLVFQKESRWVYGLFTLSVITYFGLGLSHHPLNWNSLQYFPSSLLGRVATETIAGPLNRVWFQYLEVSMIFGLLLIAFVGGMIGFSWKKMKGEEKWFHAIGAYFVVTTLAVALLGRELGDYYHLINGSPRYTYLPRIIFCVMLMTALYRLYQISPAFRKAHWVLAIWVLYANAGANVVYQTDLEVGQSVRDYVAYLDENERDCAPGEERWFTLRRGDWRHPGTPPDWSIPANLCQY